MLVLYRLRKGFSIREVFPFAFRGPTTYRAPCADSVDVAINGCYSMSRREEWRRGGTNRYFRLYMTVTRPEYSDVAMHADHDCLLDWLAGYGEDGPMKARILAEAHLVFIGHDVNQTYRWKRIGLIVFVSQGNE